jgi:type IV pilus assembly protein PilW
MTLLDFMVGLTIGLLVVLAAVGSLIMTRDAARTMNDNASLEQQASLVMMQIGQQVSQAGAINGCLGILGNGTASNASLTGAGFRLNNQSVGVGPAIAPGNPDTSIFGGSAPASFTVSYAAPRDTNNLPVGTNCVGGDPVSGAGVIDPGTGMAFTDRIVNQFFVNTTNHDLMCGDGVATASHPIASHVADMQNTYLVVNSAGNITYKNSMAATDWPNVKGIQVCLEMQGDPTEASPKPASTSLILRDCLGNSFTPPNDGRVYRFVRQTFYLRNTN